MRRASIALSVGVVLQFGIPAWKLSQPRPQRFGWQMYTAVLPMPTLIAIVENGEIPLHVPDYLAFSRGDLPPGAWAGLPAHVCRVQPEVMAVRHRPHEDAPWEVHPCR